MPVCDDSGAVIRLPAATAGDEGAVMATGLAHAQRDTPPLLVVDDVTLQYKTDRSLVTATWKVGFEVYAGERFVVLGPSGCGKSTLLKAIAGFMPPVAGTIRLGGRAIERPGSDRMMVFQEFDQLLPWKTVLGNVLFPLTVNRVMPRREATEHARALLAKVNLTPFADVELILCSEHTIDRSAHLFQNKSRRQATHHFELICLTWTNFKSIGLHSLYGDFNHVFDLHDRNAFHVFKIKVTQEFGLCRRRREVKYLHFGVLQLHS
jgi:ABC-type glutathione transport system ATPase component